MRIAVTGGSGNIGTVVAKTLLARGHEVIILDKRPPSVEGARYIFVNLQDRQILQPIIETCDAVAHLGEIPNSNIGESPHDVYLRNVGATSTVLQTAADLKTPRVVYASSCQAYGVWGNPGKGHFLPISRLPMDETQPLRPANCYALAKAAMEQYARMMAETQNLSVAAFRLPMVPHLKWLPRWSNWVRAKPAWFKTEVDGLWSWLHVEDVAEAFALGIEKPRPGFEAYHFSAPDMIGFEPVRERIQSCGLTHWPALPPDWPELASLVSTAKAREHFGWTPKHTFAKLSAESLVST